MIYYLVLIITTITLNSENYYNFKISSNKDFENLKICGIKITCLEDNFVELKISAFLPSRSKSKENILSKVNNSSICLFTDSVKVGNSISKECKDEAKKDAISLGLLVDCSGSMSSAISEFDGTQRMFAAKQAISNFVYGLKQEDKAFLMTFSSFVSLTLDFSNNQNLLLNSINSISLDGATQFHGGILQSLNKLNEKGENIKAIIVLSDGMNNIYPFWGPSFVHKYCDKLKDTKVYIIALGLGSNIYEIEGKENMRILSQLSGGGFFDVYNAGKLDSVYKALRKEIKSDECCELKFKIKTGDLFQNRNLTLVVNIEDSTYFAYDYFRDICKGWGGFQKCETCIRVRFAIATDENHYSKLKRELEKLEYETIEHNDPLAQMDLISYQTFGSAEEARDYIEEFKVKLKVYSNKSLSKWFSPDVLIDYQEEEKW